jgi:hypothetical protein
MTRPRLALFALVLVLLSTGARRRAVQHPPSDFPHANADAFSVARGNTLTRSAANGVLANDSDPLGKALTVVLVTTTAHGTLALSADGGFSYVNDGTSATTDSFTYKASNGVFESAAATVVIAITANAPVAANDSFSLQGASLNVPAPGVLTNDVLNDAVIVSYGPSSGEEQPALGTATVTLQGGSVTLNADGGLTYTPRNGFTGSDTFKYKLQNSGGSATATVTIAVQAATPDFFVTSPGFFYSISGLSGQNPVITLKRGRTYVFNINTDASHPFFIVNAPEGSVTNNNISSGLITFAVPTTPQNYDYICSIHGFGNRIMTSP